MPSGIRGERVTERGAYGGRSISPHELARKATAAWEEIRQSDGSVVISEEEGERRQAKRTPKTATLRTMPALSGDVRLS